MYDKIEKMDNFDLKKYLAENKLNEAPDSTQSAVEWLASELSAQLGLSNGSDIAPIVNKAKAKEIENMKNAFNYGQTDLGMEADEYIDFINFK